MKSIILSFAVVTLASACSSGGSTGGSGTPTPGPQGGPPTTPEIDDRPASRAEASRFLARATFGPTDEGIDAVMQSGYRAWIDAQIAMPATLTAEQIAAGLCVVELESEENECSEEQLEEGTVTASDRRARLWWESAVWAPDQLRQRVAFALSEIFVVSVNGALGDLAYTAGTYSDMLASNAFGSYRTLLEDVTLHPAMGIYLSMVKNRKPDPVENTRPDENYAREIMQLFSIGLVELEADGRVRLDGNGQPIPTYDQSVIVGMAHALTGWNFREASDANLEDWLDARETVGAMQPSQLFHDTEPKTLVTGQVVPGMRTAEQDLTSVLDLLSTHANVGPFLGKQLIQRLVTSNPSPEYVGRVSAVFADNGQGVRGDLGAVVRAILLDSEAMEGHARSPDTFGKVREPLLCATAMLRAFRADQSVSAAGLIELGESIGQQAYLAPSVFNFFRPDFATAELRSQGLVAPEMQITTHSYSARVANELGFYVFFGSRGAADDEFESPTLNIDREIAMAGDPGALVAHLEELLVGGLLAPETKSALTTYLGTIPADEGEPSRLERALEAIYLVLVSPEFAVQK